MCGIAGFWNHGSGRPAHMETIRGMADRLVHRGPDDDGYHLDGTLALGMRRLAVTDVAGGKQPMPNEDHTVHVVFNGAIYNHLDLRAELEAHGHRFRTRCDTEVIVHAWEEWGADCVTRFNGMFAFAVWDARTQRLFLARDRMGIKPLYVWQGAEGVVFGSELKAVLAAPWVPREWDIDAIDDFLTYEYVPAPRSILRGVTKLPQGCTLLLDAGRVGIAAEPQPFWTLEAGDGMARSVEHDLRTVREGLTTAVRRRLMADVPLGAFLSGGVDSTIIVSAMAQDATTPVHTFSMGFADRSYNELPYARAVATHYQTAHREELVTADVVGLAERLASAYDEPFGDVSAFPTYLLSTIARRDVTVALSGDGGDELFAGYDSYRAHQWAQRIRWVTRSFGWSAVDRLLEGMPPRPEKKGAVNKAKRFAEGLRKPESLEHARWLVFWDLTERRALYTNAAHDAVAARDPFGWYRGLLEEGSRRGFHGLQRQLYADVRGYLADDILAKVDRASMAASLEVRVPFLDHEFVEAALRIPADRKLRDGQTKWVLREAFADRVPEVVARRGKEGFSMPMKQWLMRELQPMMRDLLSPARVAARGLFDGAAITRLMDEHVAGRKNHAHRLWCLMALELSMQAVSGVPRAGSGES
jgi:asparagine synthase (glutamine-hydrolysing)